MVFDWGDRLFVSKIRWFTRYGIHKKSKSRKCLMVTFTIIEILFINIFTWNLLQMKALHLSFHLHLFSTENIYKQRSY